MTYKKLSGLLWAAGLLALLCGGLMMAVYLCGTLSLLRLDYTDTEKGVACVLAVFGCLISGLYLYSFVQYFRITRRIGSRTPFCNENAEGLRQIFLCFMSAAGLWLLSAILCFWPGLAVGPMWFSLPLCALGTLALGVLAYALSRLIRQAIVLQEENRLTV